MTEMNGELDARACPHAMGADERKSALAAGACDTAAIEHLADGSVRIGGFDLARQVLRSGGTRQAGFKAELTRRFIRESHVPVLFQEGEAHQKQRSATARFFAPKVVTTRYRDLMLNLSEDLIARFTSAGHGDLDAMSFELAVAVAAEIVGLTDSDRKGMARRLNSFFAGSTGTGTGFLAACASFITGQYRLLKFYLADVWPAIRSRRRQAREDVISHLIEQNYSKREILTECLIYGAAGMATTREFIVMAAWHLFDRADLRQQFLAADEAGQMALLEEILRLEPVVGKLYRRTERELQLNDAGQPVAIAADTLIEVDVRSTNADKAAAGECPFHLDPARKRPESKASESLMSFGDGPHRCPGATVALQETAIFLNLLLRIPGIRLEQAPSVGWNPLTASYELRGARLAIG